MDAAGTKAPIPILRIFDEPKAREFYLDFLGFTLDWEHRYGDNFPVYLQISRGLCVIHLSEHHGDASPGSSLRIEMAGLDDYRKLLHDKNYKYFKPGVEGTAHGFKELCAPDPFGNKLIFIERET